MIKDKDLRNKLGQAGRETVKEKFKPDKMVDTIEEVYKKLLEKKHYEKLQEGTLV